MHQILFSDIVIHTFTRFFGLRQAVIFTEIAVIRIQ